MLEVAGGVILAVVVLFFLWAALTDDAIGEWVVGVIGGGLALALLLLLMGGLAWAAMWVMNY